MDLKLGKPLHELLCKNVGIELDFASFLFKKKTQQILIFAFENKQFTYCFSFGKYLNTRIKQMPQN